MTESRHRNLYKGVKVQITWCGYCDTAVYKQDAVEGDNGYYYHRQCLQDETGIVQANRIDAMMASLEDS